MRPVCCLCPFLLAAEQIITSRPLYPPLHPGSLGGRTDESNAGEVAGRSVAYDSRTFPAVLTNDPTYYWATTATAACRRLSHLPSLTLAVPTPPHTNAVPSWQDHQAARSSLARSLASGTKPRQSLSGHARPSQAGPLSKLSAGSGRRRRRPRRPPFRPSVHTSRPSLLPTGRGANRVVS